MLMDVFDGAYCLVRPNHDSELASVDTSAGPVTITPSRDFLLVTTFDEDVELDITVTVLNSPWRQSGPPGWEARATAEFEVSGDLALTNIEFDPEDRPLITLEPGRYFVEIHARSRGLVAKNDWMQFQDRPTEQHSVYLSLIREPI